MGSPLRRRRGLLLLAVAGGLLSSAPAALAAPGASNLAVLLQAMGGRVLGLYDGVRLVRIDRPGGTRIIAAIQCEQQLWRVARIEHGNDRPDFRSDPFEPAPGIGRSSWCTSAVRPLE